MENEKDKPQEEQQAQQATMPVRTEGETINSPNAAEASDEDMQESEYGRRSYAYPKK